MENVVVSLLSTLAPTIEKWLRETVSEEVTKAIEADREKQKPQKMYSREEVCKMLQISIPTLWSKTKKGEIKACQIGRRVLYEENEVKRLLGQ